jgi:hypothetical protein
VTIQQRAAKRLCDGSGNVARTVVKRAASLPPIGKIAVVVVAWKGGPGILDTIHQQPYLLAAGTAAWTWAAWRSAPPPPPRKGPPPAAEVATEGAPCGGGGADKTVIQTAQGTATMTPNPHQNNRTDVTWTP